jgi:hypothetical protein
MKNEKIEPGGYHLNSAFGVPCSLLFYLDPPADHAVIPIKTPNIEQGMMKNEE